MTALLKFDQFTQITFISCPSMTFQDHFFAPKTRENYLYVKKASEQVKLGYTPKKVQAEVTIVPKIQDFLPEVI